MLFRSLLDIVNDILDFSRIEAGAVEIQQVPFSIEQALRDALKPMAIRAKEKNLAFSFSNVTALDGDLIGDPLRLRQVMLNLVGNAIKFTERGAVMIRVSSTSRGDDEVLLRFSVRDTGIGIDAEHLPRMFQPFSQADASIERSYGGTGLGLAICKRLVEVLNGRIFAQSERGVGSEFIFEVPCGLRKGQSSPHAEQIPDVPQLQNRIKVLVVEDNPVNRFVVQRLLSRRGHQVIEAGTAVSGLQLVNQECPDLVLMDLQLPGMGGMEALAQLRRAPGRAAGIPVVALTAHALIGDRERCLAAGMDGYVSKPFSAKTLMEEISRVMADHPACANDGPDFDEELVTPPLDGDSAALPVPPSRFSRAIHGDRKSTRLNSSH